MKKNGFGAFTLVAHRTQAVIMQFSTRNLSRPPCQHVLIYSSPSTPPAANHPSDSRLIMEPTHAKISKHVLPRNPRLSNLPPSIVMNIQAWRLSLADSGCWLSENRPLGLYKSLVLMYVVVIGGVWLLGAVLEEVGYGNNSLGLNATTVSECKSI